MKSYVTILIGVLFVIWVYLLSVLKRKNMPAFTYLLGTSGMFGFLFVLFRKQLTYVCSLLLMQILTWCSHLFSWYEVYSDYNTIFICNQKASISLFVDYECCGLVEILTVVSIIVFYKALTTKEKIIYTIIGIVYTMIANVIRLLVVSGIIAAYGNDYYYKAHSFAGRIIFYLLTMGLYFYLVSYPQIKKQKVGQFSYDS